MTGWAEKLEKNFIVATFIPSLGFFVLASLILAPILPHDLREQLSAPLEQPLSGMTLLLLIVSLLLAYTLFGLNTFIYKLTEGYFLLHRSTFWRKRQHRKARQRREIIENVERLLEALKKHKDARTNTKLQRIIAILQQKRTALKASYRADYPQYAPNILPTRFGNIFRAAESYSYEQYGIDAVTMWPRLLHVIAPPYQARIEESNNGLAFIVNSMVLSFALGLICLGTAGLQLYSWHLARDAYEQQMNVPVAADGAVEDAAEAVAAEAELEPVRPLHFWEIEVSMEAQRAYRERTWLYLLGTTLFVGFSIVFYNASLPAVRQYGSMICSAYDLFRFDLAKQLKLPLPTDWDDEKEIWSVWSEFVWLGRQKNLKPIHYQYEYEGTTVSSADEEE